MSKVGAVRKKTGGRKKGTPNKTTALLKDAILQAAEAAGNKIGKDGLVSYLTEQAEKNPVSFNTLLGKVLPLQVQGPDDEDGKPTAIRISIVDPRS